MIPMEVPIPESILERVLEELTGRRRFSTVAMVGMVISVLGISLSIMHLFFGYFAQPDPIPFRTVHVSAMLVLAYLLYPLGRKSWREPPTKLFLVDLLLIALAIAVEFYILRDMRDYEMRILDPTLTDIGVGTLGIVLVLEAARRAVGIPMVTVVVVLMAHTMLAGVLPGPLAGSRMDWTTYVTNIFMDVNGIFGLPIQVMVTYIMLFMIFGATLLRTGIGSFFMDVAYGLVGGSPGGPAKAAVVSSGIMGTVSGSAVSNVVVTGSFTIPLMKRLGYKPHFAGAVEAVASTGGQIMPPVMGAAAFILAVILGVSYWAVAIAAAIPAVLYYVSLYFMVDFEAKKLGLMGMSKSDLPRLTKVFAQRGILILPLIVIVVVLSMGMPAGLAGFWAIVSSFVVSFVRKDTRMSFRTVLGGLEEGGTSAVTVSVACAAAGIIIGSVSLSGLGLKLSAIMIDLAHGHLIFLLFFTAIAALILGMGLTTSAVYITVAVLLVPGLIKMGVVPMAAHLFAFYFGCLSAITPPVALAAYAAAGIAKDSPWKIGWTAVRIGIAAYIVPFMFAFSPELILAGRPLDIAWALVTALIGVFCLAASAQSWFMGRQVRLVPRLMLLASALLLIKPGVVTDLIGFFFIGMTVIWVKLVDPALEARKRS